jgi:hypothetical protein
MFSDVDLNKQLQWMCVIRYAGMVISTFDEIQRLGEVDNSFDSISWPPPNLSTLPLALSHTSIKSSATAMPANKYDKLYRSFDCQLNS